MNDTVVEVRELKLNRRVLSKKLYLPLKRVIDFIIALIFCLLLLPIGVVVYIAIKLEDGKNPFYTQKRTGKNGKVFNMYKFRSMRVETEINGRKLTHDERVTKVGKFIRKTSIDELPQIINILKGDMSFIGPRPWITEYYDSFNDTQKRRVEVLPGLSGLAQVKGRNGLTIFDKIKYDLEYVNNISLMFDLKIIFMTIYTVLKKEEAEIIQESIEEELKALRETNGV